MNFKIILTILILIAGLNISYAETGERFKLLWEVGERIKYEERKPSPDPAKLNIIKGIKTELTNGIEAVYNSMGRKGDPWANDIFTKQQADILRALFPQDDFFKATTTIGSSSEIEIVPSKPKSKTFIYWILGSSILALLAVWRKY